MSTMTMVVLDGRFRLGDEITRTSSRETGRDGDLGLRPKIHLRNDKACVYRAKDLETGATVAIKILNRGSARVAEFRSRFQRDVAIMRSFEHPHVVKTIAAGTTTEGQPYFAMEYLSGQTLAERLDDQGPLPPAEMAVCLEQIASALDAAHARGIVHRDINPSAIMILANPDGTTTYKLLDFGLAKELARPSASEAEMTGKQTILGKASYLSPEQARGGDIDLRSDVYALGITLYQSLTGRLPFEGETDFQVLLAQINGTVPPFPRRWSNLPGAHGIEAVVMKALSKNPADRPATAGILANLFKHALHSRSKQKALLSWPMLMTGVVLIASAVLLGKWLL